jgi:hypothetical protein
MDKGAIFLTGIGVVFGGFLNIVAAFLVEKWRAPKLKLSIEPVVDAMILPTREQYKATRLWVSNEPLRGIRGWFMIRSPALVTQAIITFHQITDGQKLVERPMAGRWADTLQPAPMPILDRAGNTAFFLNDPGRFGVGTRMDIYPGERPSLDIAVRFADNENCYGWNNETYLSRPFGRNDTWRLPRGSHLVKVSILSSGPKSEGVFRLVNDGGLEDFRLEDATETEIARVQ